MNEYNWINLRPITIREGGEELILKLVSNKPKHNTDEDILF